MKLRMFQRYARFLGLFSLVAALVSFTACRQVDPKTPKIDQEESSSQAVSSTESDTSSDDGSWEDLDEGEDEDLSSLDSPDGSGESDGQAAVRTTHEVKPGETLWDIADQYYGRGIYWRAIRDHNNLSQSGEVNAGQTLEIPELTEQRKEELRQLAADESGGTSSSSGSSGGASGGDTYVTQQGDTFWKIAKRVYGSGTQWKRIWRANKSKVPNPDKLKAGTKIRIPGANASSAEKGTSDEQKGAN